MFHVSELCRPALSDGLNRLFQAFYQCADGFCFVSGIVFDFFHDAAADDDSIGHRADFTRA